MDYRKYLREGFQLKEFTNVKDGQDMGDLWHKADELGKSLKAKVDNKEPLTEEDKEELNNIIHTGEEYLNALKANFAADPEGGSPIERECAGLVEGKESIEDHLKVYKELLNSEADNNDTSDINDNEALKPQLVDIVKNALQSKSSDIVSYLNARDTYNALATGTGADTSNDDVASALAILNDAFNAVNKNLHLELENRSQLDKLISEAEHSEIEDNTTEIDNEVAEIEKEDIVQIALKESFIEYYITIKKENELLKSRINARNSGDASEIQKYNNLVDQLNKDKVAVLQNSLANINDAIKVYLSENVAYTSSKGEDGSVVYSPTPGYVAYKPIENIESLSKTFNRYLTDPDYADLKAEADKKLEELEANDALISGDASQITALANTFRSSFKTEQDVEVWKKCILRYAKLLAAYNVMMKNAIDAGLIPSKLEDVQKYVRYASLAVTIASFIPPLNAAAIPLKITSGILRTFGGVTTTVLQGKKSIEAFKNGNPREGVVRLLGAGMGAFAAYSGFSKLSAGISDYQTYKMFKPENLEKINFAAENAKIDEQLSALKNTNGGPLTTDAADKIAALEAKKELLGTQQNMYLLSTNPDTAQQCNEQLRNFFSGKIPQSELTGYINTTQQGVKEAAELAAENARQDIAEKAEDNAIEQLGSLEALKNMPESEAREMANKWAANGGWYANVLANGTEEDKEKAFYALRVINNSADGQKQIALYNELRRVSANISNTDKLLNGTGGYMSQQADLYADVSKNVKGSIYNNLGKVWGKDVALTDEQRHDITAKLYDACTTHGSDSTLSVGQVQKILTDSGINSIEDQKKCLSSIFTGYKTNMDPTKVLTPKDTNVFKLADQVKSGDLSGVQGKILDGSLQNAYNDNATALTNKIDTLQNNLAAQRATQASLRNQINGMF